MKTPKTISEVLKLKKEKRKELWLEIRKLKREIKKLNKIHNENSIYRT